MGNAWYCKKCEEGGDINLSKECVERYINEEKREQHTTEDRNMYKLRCLDDLHSRRNGLTVEDFESLATKVSQSIASSEKHPVCESRFELFECLRQNPHCLIKCKKEMDEFMDCVDRARIRIIKQKIEEMRKPSKKTQFT